MWHQCLEQYDDPDGFRANLNSSVEALRTVTFMLQNEKKVIPEFDAWYGRWQAEMKADPLMKWLSDARTEVIHRADLETHSLAVASVHNNLTIARLTYDVPPLLSTPEIAIRLAEGLPDPFRKHRAELLLSVERRWCVRDLPGHELLETLAHVYGVLSRLVVDAHKQVGCEYETLDSDGEQHRTPDGRMPCMIATSEMRTVRLRLEDGRTLTARSVTAKLNRDEAEKGAKRYGIKNLEKLKKPPGTGNASTDPFELAESLLEMAKIMLKKDKYLERCIFLRTPQGLQIVNLNARDRTEKYALMRTMAEQVRALQADVLIDIGEAWTAPIEDIQAGQVPEKARHRREVILVSVLTKSGVFRGYQTVFSRGLLGAIKLEDTEIMEGGPFTYLAPILEAWNLPRPSSHGPNDEDTA
jgi:hypothetical protein